MGWSSFHDGPVISRISLRRERATGWRMTAIWQTFPGCGMGGDMWAPVTAPCILEPDAYTGVRVESE